MTRGERIESDRLILVRVVASYLTFSTVWIVGSDRVAELLSGSAYQLSQLQSVKGLLFVSASAAVIFLLLRRELLARRAAETRSRQHEVQYRALFENSLDAMLITIPDGGIVAANPSACTLFGRTQEELCAAGRDLIVDREDPRVRALLEVREREGKASGVIRFARADGTRFEGEVTSVVFQTTDGPRTSMSIRDLTERQAAEQAMRAMHVMELARDRAEQADRIKSAFLATMSHELRTPLNSVIGFTGILLQEIPGKLNEEQRKQLTMVRSSARHLLALINDVLDLSKIEAGQLEVERRSFEVRALLSEVCEALQPSAREKGLKLELRVGSGVGVARGDKRRFRQILWNLGGNAIKFTERGEVVISAAQAPGGWLEVTVRDTGIGIRAEDQAKLFQPFFQAENGISRRYDGTGLGLSISARLARLMGGSIGVESSPGDGSAFIVRVPAADDSSLGEAL